MGAIDLANHSMLSADARFHRGLEPASQRRQAGRRKALPLRPATKRFDFTVLFLSVKSCP